MEDNDAHDADGMIELWTIERPDGNGIHIHDLKDTEEEARAEIEKLGHPWKTVKITMPYKEVE